MKKSIVALLVLLPVISLLLAALVFLRQNEPGDTQMSNPSSGLPNVYEFSTTVRSIHIRQAGQAEFTLQNLAPDASADISATLTGWESLPVDVLRLNGILRAAASLSYTDLLFESLEDGAPFGIDTPRATVEITAMDGQTVTLIIGDDAPGNVGVYLKAGENGALYLVPAYLLDAYLLPQPDFLSHTVTPPSAALDFSRMTLGGRIREETGETIILPGNAPGSFQIASPIEHNLDPVAGIMALRSIFDLRAEHVVSVRPEENDLSTLGLDAPYATAVLEGGETGGFSLRVSEPDEGGTAYLFREDIPLIYTVRADNLPWLNLQFYDLMDKTAHAPDMDELAGILIETRGEKWAFNIAGDAGEPQVKLDGADIGADSFRNLYSALVSAELSEPAVDIPVPDEYSTPLFSVTYRYRAGETHTVCFYEGPPRRLLIRVDDGMFYLTQSVYLERLLEELDNLAAKG